MSHTDNPVPGPEEASGVLTWLMEPASDDDRPTGGAQAHALLRGPPSAAALQDKVPDVEVLEFVGQGGMGWVYRARQKGTDRVVALKLLRDDRPISKDADTRFEDEARIMATLNEPGIVTCYACGHTISDGRFYFIMEWVEGLSLDAIIENRNVRGDGPLPVNEALDLIIPVGKALAAAHAHGIIHRDVKPGNIMRTLDRGVRVLDFGLALRRNADGAFKPAVVGGSHGFAAPEQMGGARKVDHRTDIYGLAATLYALISGEAPLGYFEPPSVHVPVDSEFDALLKRALHTSMSERPATMAAFVEALEKFRSGTTSSTASVTFAQLLGPADESEGGDGSEVEATQILLGCGGAEFVESGRNKVLAKCLTPCAAASLALRWLRALPTARIGIASDHPRSGPEATAGRLAALAYSGQILVTRQGLDAMRTAALRDPGAEGGRAPLFHLHGIYTWLPEPGKTKGAEEVVGQIQPWGMGGQDPFRPPINPVGSRPKLDHDAGWFVGDQLATGGVIAGSGGWVLRERLGVGGYGEVWLADRHGDFNLAAFKFCYDASRLEAFRREWDVRERLATKHPREAGSFVRLHGKQLAQAPFWLRMDYYPLGNLAQWLGGAAAIPERPFGQRIELMVRLIRAVALAHEAGIVHRDLKPSNILLIEGQDPDTVYPLLTDFGLSGLDETAMATHSGALPAVLSDTQSKLLKAGTRRYAAPEPVTSEKSDVYALGVILYQIVTGQVDERPEEGWKDDVSDPVLREDIASAIRQVPERRISARQLAENLANLTQRRGEWARRDLHKRIRTISAACIMLLGLSFLLALILSSVWQQKKQVEMEARLEIERAKIEKERAMLKAVDTANAINNLSPYLDYSKVATTPHVGVGQFKSIAQALVDSYWLTKKGGASVKIEKLKSRVQFQVGISTVLSTARSRESAPLEMALLEVSLDACESALKVKPGDDDFAKLIVTTAIQVAALTEDDLGVSTDEVFRYFPTVLDNAQWLQASPEHDDDDAHNLVKICALMAGNQKAQGQLRESAKRWMQCKNTAEAALSNPLTKSGLLAIFAQYKKIAEKNLSEIEALAPHGH